MKELNNIDETKNKTIKYVRCVQRGMFHSLLFMFTDETYIEIDTAKAYCNLEPKDTQ